MSSRRRNSRHLYSSKSRSRSAEVIGEKIKRPVGFGNIAAERHRCIDRHHPYDAGNAIETVVADVRGMLSGLQDGINHLVRPCVQVGDYVFVVPQTAVGRVVDMLEAKSPTLVKVWTLEGKKCWFPLVDVQILDLNERERQKLRLLIRDSEFTESSPCQDVGSPAGHRLSTIFTTPVFKAPTQSVDRQARKAKSATCHRRSNCSHQADDMLANGVNAGGRCLSRSHQERPQSGAEQRRLFSCYSASSSSSVGSTRFSESSATTDSSKPGVSSAPTTYRSSLASSRSCTPPCTNASHHDSPGTTLWSHKREGVGCSGPRAVGIASESKDGFSFDAGKGLVHVRCVPPPRHFFYHDDLLPSFDQAPSDVRPLDLLQRMCPTAPPVPAGGSLPPAPPPPVREVIRETTREWFASITRFNFEHDSFSAVSAPSPTLLDKDYEAPLVGSQTTVSARSHSRGWSSSKIDSLVSIAATLPPPPPPCVPVMVTSDDSAERLVPRVDLPMPGWLVENGDEPEVFQDLPCSGRRWI
eukprot:TRINITY_DN23766_c0_g1_i2.p1 TRINITY_DN23766_c0_g1~~TRINITY_DN23766_c0_g1_i2.p1  ORF type:complete len:526 (-),score=44.32 TRINITY_DN23766_c0_g1_i2:46-1623(-)